MADERINIEVASTTKKSKNEQTGKELAAGIKSGLEQELGKIENGYIKLGVDITKYKYPKQKTGKEATLHGPGTDYSKLQKAQDELISNWKKLSKKGFFSQDEDIINVLKSFRNYQSNVRSQYKGKFYEEDNDKQVAAIRKTIGTQIFRYLTRIMGNVDIGEGRRGMFTATVNDSAFEKYAKDAVQKLRAAQALNLDLNNDEPLTKEQRSRIHNQQMRMEMKARAERNLEQRKYEKENAKEIAEENQRQLQEYHKSVEETHKRAIAIPKSLKPLEDVSFSETPRRYYGAPREDTRSLRQIVRDYNKDRSYEEHLEGTQVARKSDAMGIRQQAWDPTYLFKDFMERMERGGTWVDTNSLLSQTMQNLKEWYKDPLHKVVERIDKDEAIERFNALTEKEEKEFTKIANDLAMSKQLLVNVAKVQGGLIAGRDDVTPEDLEKAIMVAVADAVEHGKSQSAFENFKTAIFSITNMLMNRHSNMKDSMGSTVGRRKKVPGTKDQYIDEKERGEGINPEGFAIRQKTLTKIFEKFQDVAEKLFEQSVKQFPEFYDDRTGRKKEKVTTFDKVFMEKLNAASKSMETHLGSAAEGIATLLGITKVNNAATLVADDKQTKILDADAKSGGNTDEAIEKITGQQTNSTALMQTIQGILENLYGALGNTPYSTLLQEILKEIITIRTDGISKKGKSGKKEVEVKETALSTIVKQTLKGITIDYEPSSLKGKHDKDSLELLEGGKYLGNKVGKDITNVAAIRRQHEEQLEREHARMYQPYNTKKGTEEVEKNIADRIGIKPGNFSRSEISTSLKDPAKWSIRLKDAFLGLIGVTAKYKKVITATSDEQDKLAAEQVKTFGLTRGRDITGDKIAVARSISLWRGKDKFKDLFPNLKLTEGIKVDTTEVTNELGKLLTGRSWRNAQMGGSPLRQILGYGTGFIGMPSIEKSRAAAEGLSQINANIREAMNNTLKDIQDKESAIAGLIDRGDLRVDEEGNILEGSTEEAKTLVAQLESVKLIFDTLLADMGMVNKTIKSSHGDIGKVMKRLRFTSPLLRENNAIVYNINAGYDKGRKSIKIPIKNC